LVISSATRVYNATAKLSSIVEIFGQQTGAGVTVINRRSQTITRREVNGLPVSLDFLAVGAI
jgi:hypothetical protein